MNAGFKPLSHKEMILEVGMEVLGKMKSNVWCHGTIQEVQKTHKGQKYKVEFTKSSQTLLLHAHHVSSVKRPALEDLFIGCRVVASCKDKKGKILFNAAVLTELPERPNHNRFCVFYDDGQAAYLALPDLHVVCKQLKNVWRDIKDETNRLQVKEYLRVYPNTITVQLCVGQDIKAMRNGKFEACAVVQSDDSLIQICYKKDELKEWVYKGSYLLEHIVKIKKCLVEEKLQQTAPQKTQQLPQQKTQQLPQQKTQQLPQQKTQQLPQQKTQQSIQQKTQQLPQQKTQQLPQQKTQQLPQQKTQQSIQQKTQQLPQQKTQQLPQQKTQQLPQQKTQQLPQQKTQQLPQQKTQQLPQQKTQQLPQQKTQQLLKQKTQQLPQQKTQQLLKQKTQQLPQQKTQQLPKQKTQQLPQQKTQQLPEQKTQQLPKQKTQQLPQQKTQQLPQQKTQQLPQQKTQQLPEQKTQQLPQQKTQQLPEQNSQRVPPQETQQPDKTGNAVPQHDTTFSSKKISSTTVTSEADSPAHVTRRSDTTVTKAPFISPQNIMSAAFQPKVVLQRLSMLSPLSPAVSVLESSVQTIESAAEITTSTLRSAKRPAPDEEEGYVSQEEENILEQDQYKSTYLIHRCCPVCLDGVRPSEVNMHRGENPLLIPLLFKFRRMTAKRRINGKVFSHIFYCSPCGRSLCDMLEVQEYMFETRCNFLFLEMFCMDPFVLVNRTQPRSTSTGQPHLYLPDVSEGREVLPVPCINEVDNTPAPNITYIKDRIPAPSVSINTSFDFLIGCDCTDGCLDRSKCACYQLTIEATSLCKGGPVDASAGYTHKRLPARLPTGVYECNPMCRCDRRMCSNRLVQHGLQLRLEVFMTQNKGWGIRCRDDVAKGTFVSVFTGKIINEDQVKEDDTMSSNEYLTDLDFIEGVEKLKEGYESEAYCSDTEVESNKTTINMNTGQSRKKTLCQEDSRSGKGQATAGPNFARKSFRRRVKPLEITDTQNEKTRAALPAKNTRRLFNGEDTCYIIEPRQEGNLSRYINHSCSPNLFVQNIFVDTHDLRFPWVAFFASKRIKAGTELTWDYNYEVGSVEGKVLLCRCGSLRCTGRLL